MQMIDKLMDALDCGDPDDAQTLLREQLRQRMHREIASADKLRRDAADALNQAVVHEARAKRFDILFSQVADAA